MKKFLLYFSIIAIIIIGFALYIASLDTDYEVERSKLIQAPIAVVYNTVNDYTTWVNWGPWRENDDTFTSQLHAKTSGIDAGYSWNSRFEANGSIRTTDTDENKKIEQKIVTDRRGVAHAFWKFEEVDQGTKVTWKTKGKLDFNSKLFFTFVGGTNNAFNLKMEGALNALDAFVIKEIEKHSFTSNGVVDYSGGYYVQLTTACAFSEKGEKLNKMLPDVLLYCMRNDFPRNGSLFTLYHEYDKDNNKVEFSSCYPVRERVQLTEEFALGFLKRNKYHKTTFKGNYKFLDNAWEKAFEFVKNEGFTMVKEGKPFEVYTKGHTDSANPADWVTEIYIPIE